MSLTMKLVQLLLRMGLSQLMLYRLGTLRTMTLGLLNPMFMKGLLFELSSGCNRRCWYCPQSLVPKKREVMTLDFLDAVLKKLQLKKWAGTVDIGWNNEPMLDWDSLRMGVRKIREAFPSAFVRMYSNGFGLTQEKLNELMALGLSYFFITLHENDEKRRQLILSWVPAKDQTRIRVTLFQEIAILNASGHAVEGAPPSNEKFCVMQFAPVIRLNGDITLCCCDYYSETVLGNILRDDFWQVWRKSWWQRVRIMFGSKAAKACHACYNMTRTPLRKPAPKQPAATASAA